MLHGFCLYVSLCLIFTFFISLTFKNILSLFSFQSFHFHHFLDSCFLFCPGKCKARAVLKYIHSSRTLRSVVKPWTGGLLSNYVVGQKQQKRQHSSLGSEITYRITKWRSTEVAPVCPVSAQLHHHIEGGSRVSNSINEGLIGMRANCTSISKATI